MHSRISVDSSHRLIRALDAAVAVWTAVWVAVGVWVAIDVHRLSRLSDTLGTAAAALQQTSSGLSSLQHLPFVGADLGRLATKIAATAASASLNATSSKQSVDQLAYLLGIVIVLIPSIPTLAVYLPFRVARSREVRAVRRALDGTGSDANLRRYLANRALANLPYYKLVAISDEPWQDAQEGRLDELAGAELARLGIDRHRLDRNRQPPDPPVTVGREKP